MNADLEGSGERDLERHGEVVAAPAAPMGAAPARDKTSGRAARGTARAASTARIGPIGGESSC